MNINQVNEAWKQNHPEPIWDQSESSQVTVEMCQRMHEELKEKKS